MLETSGIVFKLKCIFCAVLTKINFSDFDSSLSSDENEMTTEKPLSSSTPCQSKATNELQLIIRIPGNICEIVWFI